MATSVTLNEIVYDLWETVRPLISDDDFLDERKFKYWIHNQRALWLRNELNKNRTIDDNIIQDLGCVEVERVDASTCCGITTDCYVIRTKQEIPVTIERYNEATITRIGPVNYLVKNKTINRTFNLIPYSRAIWANNSKYTKGAIYAFLLNNKIHLISGKSEDLLGLKYINIRGVFENPEDVAKFTTCDGSIPCYSDDTKYPINRWMLGYLKDAIIKADLSILMKQPYDTTNDASPKVDGENNIQKG